MKWLNRLPPDVREKGRAALRKARSGRKARFTGKSVLPGEKPKYWDNILTPIKGASGEVTAILCVSRDVSHQREAETKLRHASEIDALTGLGNRRTLQARLHKSLSKSNSQGLGVGLLLADLDYFKHVNDTLGHAAGDHLLRVLSRRFRECLPNEASIARLRGDEFAVIIPDCNDDEKILQVARRLLKETETPVAFGGTMINGGMSLGGALFPRDAGDVSELLKCADTALNNLKSEGRGGVQMFSVFIMANAADEAEQLVRARTIIRDDAIIPYYQPKVSLLDNRLVGMEALLRWSDAQGNINLPQAISGAFSDYELATRIA